jgi:hypothetical protein
MTIRKLRLPRACGHGGFCVYGFRLQYLHAVFMFYSCFIFADGGIINPEGKNSISNV